MNSTATNSNNSATRCQHQFDNGTRCRLPIANGDSLFCTRHARLGQNQPIEEDLRPLLVKNSQDFQTAQGINFSLGNLYDLVAKNRISTRRAAVLAYISSLLLRTHAAIDSDRLNGINDPTKLPKIQSADAPPMTAFPLEPDPTKKPS